MSRRAFRSHFAQGALRIISSQRFLATVELAIHDVARLN
jgi:hypothetical protein